MIGIAMSEMFERVHDLSKRDFPDRLQHLTSLLIELRTENSSERKSIIEAEICMMYMHRLE